MMSDIFDDVLNLEEDFYQEGYEHGYRDGAEAGRIEGRSVGMKQGYEKCLEAGRLQGRALVWANRIPRLRSTQSQSQSQSREQKKPLSQSELPSTSSLTSSVVHTQSGLGDNAVQSAKGDDRRQQSQGEGESESESRRRRRRLPDLVPSNNARLEKNVTTLYGMVEPGTLPTRNDDEAVNDFDSRVKGAQGKLKVIERVVGEKVTTDLDHGGVSSTTGAGPKNSNIEDIGKIPPPPKQERSEL